VIPRSSTTDDSGDAVALGVTEGAPRAQALAGVRLHTNAQAPFTGFTQAGWIDIYDVGEDCATPRLLASRPFAGASREGNFSQDGNTFWASSLFPGVLTAVDVKDPENPVWPWGHS
jgi:hypothetical protein